VEKGQKFQNKKRLAKSSFHQTINTLSMSILDLEFAEDFSQFQGCKQRYKNNNFQFLEAYKVKTLKYVIGTFGKLIL